MQLPAQGQRAEVESERRPLRAGTPIKMALDTNEKKARSMSHVPVADLGRNIWLLLHECLKPGVIVLGEDRQIASISPDAAVLLAAVSADGAPFETTLPPGLQEIVDQAFANCAAVTDRVVTVGSGEREKVLVASALLHQAAVGASGPGVILLMQDAGPVATLEQKLEQLDRLATLGTLSASMAHEIKNALVAVKTFVDLLAAKESGDLSGIVSRELSRIDLIVSQMLKFAGPSGSTVAQIDLHEVLDRSLRLVQPQADERNVRIERSFSAQHSAITANSYQIEQVFINLFFNALSAMFGAGRLTVRTGPGECLKGEAIAIHVEDTGAGIAPEHLEKLFEPFFTTKPNGTGLGLTIARRIVDEHDGSIEVESAPGQGTTFTVLLPISRGPV
jgi:signal transduction histidine kinase